MESNNSNNFVSTSANDSSNENASFVTITTVNQMMPPVALYSTEIPQPNVGMLQDYSMINYNQNMINNNNHYLAYAQPNATPTPVVKSHHNHTTPMYSSPPNGYNTHQTGFLPMVDTSLATTNMMNNSSAMDIDDYYQSSNIESSMFSSNIYSPSTNSVTTNSSVIMMDTMSPSSPTHMRSPNAMMSPIQDTYTSPTATPYQHLLVNDATIETMYPEGMIVPTNIGMSHFNNNNNNNGMLYHDDMMLHHQQSFQPQQQPTTFFDRKGRRPLPRRHTVSTPYASNMNKGKEPDVKTNELVTSQPVLTKSRKSSLKAKRHRSLGKLDIFATSHSSPPPVPDMATFEPLSANLELWTHEQLLERVMELEKEKEAVVQTTTKFNEVTQTDGGEPKSSYNNNNSSKTIINKIRSASQTDTELDEEEEEEDDIQVCKWDTCTLELNSLDDLINHVKVDHIGSGKANYYCSWRDCIRQQKPFTKRHKMHNHLRTHTGERPFVCLEPDCGKRFSRPDSLTTHVKIHSNIRPHLCKNPNCGKAYYHLRSLRKHERSHIQKSDIPPLPSAAAAAVVAHTAQPDNSIGVAQEGDVYSEWGLSAQAAVFNVLDRETPSYI